jgi:hypothetical protein
MVDAADGFQRFRVAFRIRELASSLWGGYPDLRRAAGRTENGFVIHQGPTAIAISFHITKL